jgi:hypothetical protein
MIGFLILPSYELWAKNREDGSCYLASQKLKKVI